MAVLTESRLLRYFTFAALYLAQGVPWGFISVGYVVFLADQGLTNEQVGWAMALAYLPWSFKFLAGPVLDRFPTRRFGRRRPYIVGAQFLMGLTLLGLLLVDPSAQMTLMAAVIFIHNSCAALQDVSVDALAVDLLPESERASANGLMWAAKSAGVALGGGGGLLVVKQLGWPALFIGMALLIWAVMAIPIWVRERPAAAKIHRHRHRAGCASWKPGAPGPLGPRFSFPEVRRSFSFAAPLIGFAVALLTPAGYAMVGPVFTRMIRAELGLSEERIALMTGVIEPLAGVAGALIGGVLADRFGVRRVIGGCMVMMAAVLAVFASSEGLWAHYGFLLGYVTVLHLSMYAFNAASLGFFMTLSNPGIGATQFAIYMAATNLCYAFAAPLGGRIADGVGYVALFYVAAGVQLLTVAILPFCNPKEAEWRFRQEPTSGTHAMAASWAGRPQEDPR